VADERGGWRVCADNDSGGDGEESAEGLEDVFWTGLMRRKNVWKEIARNEQKFLLLYCGFGKK